VLISNLQNFLAVATKHGIEHAFLTDDYVLLLECRVLTDKIKQDLLAVGGFYSETRKAMIYAM
jgi:hypothetical protein